MVALNGNDSCSGAVTRINPKRAPQCARLCYCVTETREQAEVVGAKAAARSRAITTPNFGGRLDHIHGHLRRPFETKAPYFAKNSRMLWQYLFPLTAVQWTFSFYRRQLVKLPWKSAVGGFACVTADDSPTLCMHFENTSTFSSFLHLPCSIKSSIPCTLETPFDGVLMSDGVKPYTHRPHDVTDTRQEFAP